MSLNIKRALENPHKFASEVNQNELEIFIGKCDVNYHNGISIIPDNIYDILYDFLKKNYKTSKILKTTGADTISKEKIKLPVFMGSMEKIKADSNSLEKWCKKFTNSKVLSDKLDGISLLIQEKNNKLSAFTRGNGIEGQNVTWLLKYLNIGDGPNLKNAMIRGELIISKTNWTIVKTKFTEFSNPRNFVSGMVSRKSIDKELIQYLDFVGYEYIIEGHSITIKEQLSNITKCGYKCVFNDEKVEVDNKYMSDFLINRRKNSEYEIDGIIITDNGKYDRPKKNPDYAKAFKMVIDSQCVETFVKGITWTPSMYGVLKPVINLEEVIIEGVKINKVTGNNANFILNNNIGGLIGPGCKILLTRSGGVIPKILKVIIPYTEHSKNCLPQCAYVWNDTKIDLVLTDPINNDIVNKKRLAYFFKSIDVNYLKEGTINKLFINNFNSVNKILNMTTADFLSVGGVKQTLAEKLYEEINTKFNKCTLVDIMTGSLLFPGVGKKTLQLVINNIDESSILKYNKNEETSYISKLSVIKGLGNETYTKILNNMPEFIIFYNTIK